MLLGFSLAYSTSHKYFVFECESKEVIELICMGRRIYNGPFSPILHSIFRLAVHFDSWVVVGVDRFLNSLAFDLAISAMSMIQGID